MMQVPNCYSHLDRNSSFIQFLAEIVEADIAHMLGRDVESQRRTSALFLLKLKEHRRVTQTAIDDVVEGYQNLFQETIQTLHSGIRSCLAGYGVDPDSVTGLKETFLKYTDPFLGLETKHMQEKYYKDNLGLVVSHYYVTMVITSNMFSLTHNRSQ
jgi:hypothetical protein